MRKKSLLFISIIAIATLAYSLYYLSQYHIEDNQAAIQTNLEIWLKGADEAELNPTVLKMEQVADTTSHIILFQMDNGNYGYARLLEGVNGKFKIDVAGYGTGYHDSSYQVIETNKGEYMLLYGGNQDSEIDHISVVALTGEYDFTFDVAEESTFLQTAKIPQGVERSFPAELTFYDSENNEIE